jgi:hypothetical protein
MGTKAMYKMPTVIAAANVIKNAVAILSFMAAPRQHATTLPCPTFVPQDGGNRRRRHCIRKSRLIVCHGYLWATQETLRTMKETMKPRRPPTCGRDSQETSGAHHA